MRNLLWEIRAELAYWWRRAVLRQCWIADTCPTVRVSSLVVLAVIRSIADRLPAEVTLSERNILDYTDELSQSRHLAKLSGNTARIWRFASKGIRRFGDHTELLVGGAVAGRALRVNMAIVREGQVVRLQLSESDKPVTQGEETLPSPESGDHM
jgi:hypothetical protein